MSSPKAKRATKIAKPASVKPKAGANGVSADAIKLAKDIEAAFQKSDQALSEKAMQALMGALCRVYSAQVEGGEILTVEGMARGDRLDPLQEAFLDHGAVQCGFCTSGMLLSAKALLERSPHATAEEVTEVMAGHYCRCTGYLKPVEAVLAVASKKRGKR